MAYDYSMLNIHGSGFDLDRLKLTSPGDNVMVRKSEYILLQKLESYDMAADSSRIDIRGTHCLELIKDPEFNIFMPQSSGFEFSFDLTGTARVDPLGNVSGRTYVSADYGDIISTLKSALRPGYYQDVIAPFLDSRPTQFDTPRWSEQVLPYTLYAHIDQVGYALEAVNEGDFFYIGSKEHVCLLGAVKDDIHHLANGACLLQSTRPIMCFSNSYLALLPRYIPCESSGVSMDIPRFAGKPFIFPSIRRHQDHLTTAFSGEPKMMTSNLEQALEHFRTTDFAEFEDIIYKYAKSMDRIPAGYAKTGRYFF